MKRVSICLLFILFSASLLSFTGCRNSEDPLTVDNELYTRDQVPDLDDEYGGFNFADEAVGFNDPELLAEFLCDPPGYGHCGNSSGLRTTDEPVDTSPRSQTEFRELCALS